MSNVDHIHEIYNGGSMIRFAQFLQLNDIYYIEVDGKRQWWTKDVGLTKLPEFCKPFTDAEILQEFKNTYKLP